LAPLVLAGCLAELENSGDLPCASECKDGSVAKDAHDASPGQDAVAGSDVRPDTVPPLPKIKSGVAKIGKEEVPGAASGFRSVSIAVDSLAQPHIVVEKYGSGLYAYHRISGSWKAKEPWFAPGGKTGSVHMEIDAADRAWVSLTTFKSGDANITGEWVVLLGSMKTKPTQLWAKNIRPYTGFSGNLSIDLRYPNSCWRMGGQPHPTYKFNSAGGYTKDVTMSPGPSGEGIRFRIASSKGGAKPGVWHAATGIWTNKNNGGYQSSTRQAKGLGPTPWISKSYPVSGDPYYPSVGVDRKDAEIAYLAAAYQGLIINVWDGKKMLFPVGKLHQVYASIAPFGNGVERFTATWSPALGGGSFLCFTSKDSRIKLAYISPLGTKHFGKVVDIGPGSRCAAATDKKGDLHLAYLNGAIRYRKVTTK